MCVCVCVCVCVLVWFLAERQTERYRDSGLAEQNEREITWMESKQSWRERDKTWERREQRGREEQCMARGDTESKPTMEGDKRRSDADGLCWWSQTWPLPPVVSHQITNWWKVACLIDSCLWL